MQNTHHIKWFLLTILSIFTLLLAACEGADNSNTSTSSTAAPVNGFGIAANHVHSLIALPNNVLVLATHYGSYRSEDSGKTWTQVSGGNNQLMQGVMDYSLTANPLNQQRLYLLTQPAVNNHSGILGLYTSANQGRTWKLANATANFTSNPVGIPFTTAGNDTPDEVYIYVRSLAALGLKVSLDNGQHFSNTGTLPFGDLLGLLALPGEQGQILAYGNDGLARSTDGGIHWQVIKGITGSIFDMVTSGPRSPIYASGDNGIYVSKDGGKTFTPVNQTYYAFLTASPSQPTTLYGKTGTSIYHSTDGGHTWSAMPHISGNLGNLAVDPANASQLYLSLSYPTEVYRFNPGSNAWSSLTPKA